MICETNSSCEITDIVHDLSSMYSDHSLVQSLSTLSITDSMYIHSEKNMLF